MAIANLDDIEQDNSVPAASIGEKVDFKNPQDIQVSTNYTADDLEPTKVTKYIKGYPFKVDYYNFIGDVNTVPQSFNLFINEHSQTYNKIKDCIVYLESALDVTGVNELGFECTLNAGIVPFMYDIVKIELMNKQYALFECQEVKQNHYMNHTVYTLTFKLKYKFSNFTDDAFCQLESKVVRRFVYDENYILESGSPLLLTEDYVNKVKLKALREDIIHFYFHKFVDIETKYLCVNAKQANNTLYRRPYKYPILDMYIINFIVATIDGDEDFIYSTMANKGYVTSYEQTVLDAILEQDISILDDCIREMDNCVPEDALTHPILRSLYYSNVNSIVVPTGTMSLTSKIDITDYIQTTEHSPMRDIKLGDTYIFSSNFYNQQEPLTDIEDMVLRFIKKQKIDTYKLERICTKYRRWSDYEQFYLLPIIIYMLRSLVFNTYSLT